ncbi:MAG: zinc ABC transporter substrate-binding protein, partial [Alphaproteobacteria bacterium]|nr:zinc ABC transporter substrate-binding protein [Alphaproteobacteria bacterium]
MKILLISIAVLGGLFASPSSASAKVNVFACEPEWAALAKEIGGDLVTIKSATNAKQDVHHIRAKPSLLAAMRKADLVFCSGASLEIGWLPILIKKAGGPDVQPETIGWFMASDYVERLEVIKEHVDRSMGHIHPEGNPHVHLDPQNISIIADILAERFMMIDIENIKSYQQNLDTFQREWNDLIKRWNTNARPLKGQSVVVYHNSWVYLLKWLGMDVVASLEPKPGIPPTASHLETVLAKVKGKDVTAILVAPFENNDAAEWLSVKTGIPVAHMPFTVGGNDKVHDLSTLFEESIRLL